MKRVYLSIVLMLSMVLPLTALSADLAVVEKQIKARFSAVMPTFEVESVAPSAVAGLYDVQILNGPLLMVTPDADYFISGDVFATGSGKLENVSETRREKERLADVAGFDKDQLIVFTPQQGAKRWIAVFTDVKCGYCRKFHADVPALNKMGIEVRYFSFPIFDGSRNEMISALCAKDPRQAMDTLKGGGKIPENLCDKQSVDAQFALARKLGLSGTPGIVFDDGTLLKGYVEPAKLAAQMGLQPG
jgi:thiol:disulfide interchange protein DsbC